MSVPIASGRCATWARSVELDPGGTAPRCDIFVLVEHPLPWPKDVLDDPLLREIHEAAARQAGVDRAVRLQAVAGEGTAGPAPAPRRVVVFAASVPFLGYGRLESAAAPEDLPDLVASLVGTDPPPPATSVTDVLICTHGGRDSCCGSFGTKMWIEAQATPLGIRVWRTSHTGGHRFAATAVTFPDGNYWARLDAPTLQGIVDRSLPAASASAHLRGCAAFSPLVQVADRAVLHSRGWDWLDCARFGDERSVRRVELCYQAPNGERGGYDVCLDETRSVPIPDCGADPDTTTKSQPEFRVVRMTAWS